VLSEHGVKIAPSTYYEHQARTTTARELREAYLLEQIRRVRRAADLVARQFAPTAPDRLWVADA
jgi:hypothetical protein